MPTPWSSSLPQWNTNTDTHAQLPRQHPPPAPASSTYSPANTHRRSDALRTFSGFFGRFTTPRLGPHPLEAPDVPPIPVNVPSPITPWPQPQHGQHHDGLYEAGSGRPASVVEDMGVPSPLFGRVAGGEQRAGFQGGLQPPAPVHNPAAANAAGDLPVSFSPSEIGHPSPNPAAIAAPGFQSGPGPSSSTAAAAPASRTRRVRRHRRHRGAHHTHTRVDSTTSSFTKPSSKSKSKSTSLTTPRPALSDPAIKLKLLHTLISGSLFLITLIVFLAINPLTPVFSPPFRIVNSLLIVFFAIIFVHSVIRLNSMILVHRRKMRRMARRKEKGVEGSVDLGLGAGIGTETAGGNGVGRGRVQYFDDPEIGLPPPGEPIRVVLARDEDIGVNDDLVAEDDCVAGGGGAGDAANLARRDEALAGVVAEDRHGPGAGAESAAAAAAASAARVPGTPKPPPPVYGVWRGSVRADPNLLHWQRVERDGTGVGSESGSGSGSEERDFGGHSRPPPSYVTQEMRGQGQGQGYGQGQGIERGGLETLPATRYVI